MHCLSSGILSPSHAPQALGLWGKVKCCCFPRSICGFYALVTVAEGGVIRGRDEAGSGYLTSQLPWISSKASALVFSHHTPKGKAKNSYLTLQWLRATPEIPQSIEEQQGRRIKWNNFYKALCTVPGVWWVLRKWRLLLSTPLSSSVSPLLIIHTCTPIDIHTRECEWGVCLASHGTYKPFFKINFYWSIIALECGVGFYCTTKRISHTHTYILSLFGLPSPAGHHRALGRAPWEPRSLEGTQDEVWRAWWGSVTCHPL